MLNFGEAFLNEIALKVAGVLGSRLDLLQQTAEQTGAEVHEVHEQTTAINLKMDQALAMLNDLLDEMQDVKQEDRDIEQKIILMDSKLSRMEQNIDEQQLEDYYALAQSQYMNWELFDDLTRRFIPVAEYLFSKLQKSARSDYSPVILEFCRAIENELLRKLFEKYTLDLLKRYNTPNKLYQFFVTDRAEHPKETGVFVKAIQKASNTHKPEYTLGEMNTIMSMMNNYELVSGSPLLHDFDDYLTAETKKADLLNADHIHDINGIVWNFRNPSAHPEFMSFEKAQRCEELMPGRLDHLVDCLIA